MVITTWRNLKTQEEVAVCADHEGPIGPKDLVGPWQVVRGPREVDEGPDGGQPCDRCEAGVPW